MIVGFVNFKAALRPATADKLRNRTHNQCSDVLVSAVYIFMSDCFTSKRDELRLGQDLTKGNERKVTMKKPKDH